jgi:arylsulfatase A-like enzyme
MQKLRNIGVDNDTIVVFTADNGTEVFTWLLSAGNPSPAWRMLAVA